MRIVEMQLDPIEGFSLNEKQIAWAIRDLDLITVGALKPGFNWIALADTMGFSLRRLLAAMAVVESSFGTNVVSSANPRASTKKGDIKTRWERSYGSGGRYFNAAYTKKWGAQAESSWGPWQLMYPNLVRYGIPFEADPSKLSIRQIAEASFVMMGAVLEKVHAYWDKPPFLDRGAVEMIADTWNSGSFRDRFVPEEYIAKVAKAYASPPARYAALWRELERMPAR